MYPFLSNKMAYSLIIQSFKLSQEICKYLIPFSESREYYVTINRRRRNEKVELDVLQFQLLVGQI